MGGHPGQSQSPASFFARATQPQLASDVVEVDMSNMLPELEKISIVAQKYNYIGMVGIQINKEGHRVSR